MSIKIIPPVTPLLYEWDIQWETIFLIFDPKQRLWVLVNVYPQSMFGANIYIRNVELFLVKFFNFLELKIPVSCMGMFL